MGDDDDNNTFTLHEEVMGYHLVFPWQRAIVGKAASLKHREKGWSRKQEVCTAGKQTQAVITICS
jgi:hypothetical protein